jgi:hypothetical protein
MDTASGERPEPREQTVLRTVERLELRRVETSDLVTVAVPTSKPEERPSSTPRASVPLPVPAATEPEDDFQSPDQDAVDVPVALAAEPRVVVSEPTHLPAPAQEPALVIEIDRIDIRIEPERAAPPAPPRRRPDPGTMPSLSEYLARRSESPR